ncbi:hypothetical protein GCM10010306_017260 [Streptomyces umbrinus]|nr:hypothetical protein GCM10010306_017260 [Streptomyces umbrinus]
MGKGLATVSAAGFHSCLPVSAEADIEESADNTKHKGEPVRPGGTSRVSHSGGCPAPNGAVRDATAGPLGTTRSTIRCEPPGPPGSFRHTAPR